MASNESPQHSKSKQRTSSFSKRKLFRRGSSSRNSTTSCSTGKVDAQHLNKPAESPRRGFDLDSIPLDAALGDQFAGGGGGGDRSGGPRPTKMVAAIDFGTTYSGYAYSMVTSPDEIFLMARAQVGQYGAMNHKIPTILLLDEYGTFHSFGFEAREAYHDLDEAESKRWLYFEKFKMELHSRKVRESVWNCVELCGMCVHLFV